MKTLILARHAKSSWNHPGLSDHDRPLNKRGHHDAPRMAAHLALNYPPPQRIVSSTALRAMTTADALAAAYNTDGPAREQLSQLYLADVPTLLEVVRGQPDEGDIVMLVGHNPGMTDLLNALTGAGIDNLPTCGVARIGFDIDHWAALPTGSGLLLSLDVPKALPGNGD